MRQTRLTCVIMIDMNARLHISASESGVASPLITTKAVLVTHASAPTPFTPAETRRDQPVDPRCFDWRSLCGDVHAQRRVGGACEWECYVWILITSQWFCQFRWRCDYYCGLWAENTILDYTIIEGFNGYKGVGWFQWCLYWWCVEIYTGGCYLIDGNQITQHKGILYWF